MNKAWASWLGTLLPGVLALAVLTLPGTARADTGGLANLHDQARYGNRVCFTDHTHSGTGSGYSKATATADAIKAWSAFVVFEYGGEWGSYQSAVNQSVTCGGISSGYQCTAYANPCRPSGAAVAVTGPAKHAKAKVYKAKHRKHKKKY